MTPRQVRVLILNLARTGKDNPLHEWWKWSMMDENARDTARRIKKRFGRF